MNASTKLCFAFLCLILAGCQHSSMTISLDIYKDSPEPAVLLTPVDLMESRAATDELIKVATAFAADRKKLAEDLFDAYKAVWIFTGNDASDLAILQSQKQAYIDKNDQLFKTFEEVFPQAVSAFQSYEVDYIHIEKQFPPQENETYSQQQVRKHKMARALRKSLMNLYIQTEKLDQSYKDLIASIDSDFKLASHWELVAQGNLSDASLAYSRKVAQQNGTLDTYYGNAEKLRAEVGKLQETIARLAKEQGLRVKAGANVKVAGPRQPEFGESVRTVARAMSSVPLNLPDNSVAIYKATLHIRRIARMNSQIDRFQDAGDPVWRLIAERTDECLVKQNGGSKKQASGDKKPMNDTGAEADGNTGRKVKKDCDDRWSREFTRTYFYAEGNSSVVVVRDTPKTFRVQRSTNDPANLIKGQLQASRAIADAAITVAGAASGLTLDMPAKGGSGDTPADSPAPVRSFQDGSDFAERKASAEAESRTRKSVMKSLERRLSRILANAARQKDGKLSESELRDIGGLLKASQVLFAPANSVD